MIRRQREKEEGKHRKCDCQCTKFVAQHFAAKSFSLSDSFSVLLLLMPNSRFNNSYFFLSSICSPFPVFTGPFLRFRRGVEAPFCCFADANTTCICLRYLPLHYWQRIAALVASARQMALHAEGALLRRRPGVGGNDEVGDEDRIAKVAHSTRLHRRAHVE